MDSVQCFSDRDVIQFLGLIIVYKEDNNKYSFAVRHFIISPFFVTVHFFSLGASEEDFEYFHEPYHPHRLLLAIDLL